MNILLVEDDPVTMAICTAFLEGLGHSVTPAGNAEAAWTSVLVGRFQIIISDWGLPGLSGLELCARVRARKAAEYPYFILITSYQGRDRLNEAMDAGVDDFIPKPIDMDTLAVRLRVAGRIREFNAQIGVLQNLLPICMYCKKIRNDKEFWQTVESYFTAHVGADFTHSLCPDCYTVQIQPTMDELKAEHRPPA